MWYEGWEADADVKAEDFKEGYEQMTALLAEDEAWAIASHQAFHGSE